VGVTSSIRSLKVIDALPTDIKAVFFIFTEATAEAGQHAVMCCSLNRDLVAAQLMLLHVVQWSPAVCLCKRDISPIVHFV